MLKCSYFLFKYRLKKNKCNLPKYCTFLNKRMYLKTNLITLKLIFILYFLNLFFKYNKIEMTNFLTFFKSGSIPFILLNYTILYQNHLIFSFKTNAQKTELLIPQKNIEIFSIFLKKNLLINVNSLVDVMGWDSLINNRFNLSYLFSNNYVNSRFIVSTKVDEFCKVPSLGNVFKISKWLELEIWDMLGLMFNLNYGQRHILNPYDEKFFPLRRDYPLSGFHELSYSDRSKTLVRNPASLSQNFRVFSFSSPWK